ncbi:PQQ-binding-like beta-propeller repeat protein [Streptomyces olivoreticuli]|uniref:serine/threonine-protein kinase n=1 Tax=Streptomyces olivoreticuli TaxID=68246 RepID=UPI002658FAF3|nr:serine/threonine-protein kinase [Streptomyces olivoreticuli]WKK24086.1 PQQ-binding-like beta-propeller repeat protein [Streptomyces olivoreticuli]
MQQLDGTDPRVMGPFTLLGRLGTGGMGTVYLGRSPGGRTVAVKVVRADLATDEAFRERFHREVTAARQVSGAFTAPVVDADTEAQVPWMAAAFVPGVSLRDAVARHGPLPEEALRTLLAGIDEALVHVHAAGLVHRDLAPANVMLALDGPHVIDFGISRPADGAAVTAAGAIVGSPPYLSPEQALGEPLTSASDVFSLASTIAYAALGTHLFGEGHPVAVAFRVASTTPDLSRLPDGLRPLLASCLVKDPETRPTPADLIASVERAGHPEPSGSWLPEAVAAEIVAVRRVMTELQEPDPGSEGTEDPEVAPPSGLGRRRLLLGLTGATLTLAGVAGTTYALLGGDGNAKAVDRPSAADVPEATLAWKIDLSKPCPQVLTTKGVVMGVGLESVWGLTGAGRSKWTASSRDRNMTMAMGTMPLRLAGLDGSRLYVGGLSTTMPLGAAVLALDVTSGDIAWTARIDDPVDTTAVMGWWGVKDGTAYLTVSLGTGDTSLAVVAFDLASRKVRWSHDVDGIPIYAALPTGSGRFVFATESTLTALTTTDGKQAWTRAVKPGLVGAAGRHLVVGDSEYRLFVLDPATGKTQQTWTGMLSVTARPDGIASDEDGTTVYALRMDDKDTKAPLRNFSLAALDPATGRTRWATPLPTDGKPTSPVGARLLYADGNVYRMDGASVVWALNPANGKPRWKYTGLSSGYSMNLTWAAGDRHLCVTDAAAGTIATLNSNGA